MEEYYDNDHLLLMIEEVGVPFVVVVAAVVLVENHIEMLIVLKQTKNMNLIFFLLGFFIPGDTECCLRPGDNWCLSWSYWISSCIRSISARNNMFSGKKTIFECLPLSRIHFWRFLSAIILNVCSRGEIRAVGVGWGSCCKSNLGTTGAVVVSLCCFGGGSI